MKILIISIFLFFTGCAISPVKIYNQSKYFIDIEVSREHFYMECAEIDKKENKSLMTFYVIDEDTVHQFIFRSISETGWCENTVKKSYNKLTQNTHKIRLVGISPSSKMEKNYLVAEPVPEKFKRPSSLINWTFIRLETNRGCEAYFDTGCMPENYWGGLFPQK